MFGPQTRAPSLPLKSGETIRSVSSSTGESSLTLGKMVHGHCTASVWAASQIRLKTGRGAMRNTTPGIAIRLVPSPERTLTPRNGHQRVQRRECAIWSLRQSTTMAMPCTTLISRTLSQPAKIRGWGGTLSARCSTLSVHTTWRQVFISRRPIGTTQDIGIVHVRSLTAITTSILRRTAQSGIPSFVTPTTRSMSCCATMARSTCCGLTQDGSANLMSRSILIR